MISRRTLIGATAAGAGALVLTPGAATAAPVDPATIGTFRIEGTAATVALRRGAVAVVLLHIARRWHYEIGPLDTGEGGGVVGHVGAARGAFAANYRSGTAIALHPTAYPVNGSEPLWPHHEAIVRDILVDCAATVAWGGDLTPTKASHFHVVAGPRDRTLAGVAARLESGVHAPFSAQTAGTVADPATPERRDAARRLPR